MSSIMTLAVEYQYWVYNQPNQIQQTSEDREKRETNRNVFFLKENIQIL
jgi:hypothetical protein